MLSWMLVNNQIAFNINQGKTVECTKFNKDEIRGKETHSGLI